MDGLTLVTLAAVVWKIVEAVKNGISGKWGDVTTLVVVWGAGIAVAFVAAQSDIAGGIEVWDTTLGELDWASLLLLGIGLSSVSAVGYETKKAVDGGQSAEQPSVFDSLNQEPP
jgi:hypothetical protein